jgi:uncharacterized protein (DUF1330 family)
MAKGYWVVRVDVADPGRYGAYLAANQAPLARFGARFLARGGRYENPEGTTRSRNSIVEFPSYQAAVDCYNSVEYQSAIRLRQGASSIDLVVVEGVEHAGPVALDDGALWQRFIEQQLSPAEWNHELHVRVAHLHVSRYERDEAHLRMRAGIIRLNQHHGLVESAERGYFETLTCVWLLLVGAAGRRSAAASSIELLERCPELLDRSLPLKYYSRERLFTVRARSIFVEPDLAPLPGE